MQVGQFFEQPHQRTQTCTGRQVVVYEKYSQRSAGHVVHVSVQAQTASI